MHVYKFRLLSDINDDFVRDIEIQASQSFLDFHNVISQCTNLNGGELASFHICDQKWNKEKEITLIDMLNEEYPDEKNKPFEETSIMRDSLIRNFIDDPHQRLLYEYDFLNMQTFYIELLNVHIQKDESVYPRCTLKKGDLEQAIVPPPIIDDEDESANPIVEEYTDLLDDTFDIKEDTEGNEFILN